MVELYELLMEHHLPAHLQTIEQVVINKLTLIEIWQFNLVFVNSCWFADFSDH